MHRIPLEFKHSSDTRTTLEGGEGGFSSDYHVAYVAVTDIDGNFLHSIGFDSL
jgi:hypothetical protein